MLPNCSNSRSLLPRCMECRRGLAMRTLSVCPSVKRVNCDKTEEKCVQIFIPSERSFSLVFCEKNGWWGRPFYFTWNFGSTGPRWSEIADFQPIIARSASAVTPSEKSSVNTNMKSPMRFPMSLRWSSYVAPKPRKRNSKPQNCRSPSKISLRLKKVCYRVFLCENCQKQSCKAFIGLTIRAKMIGGDVSFYLKFWVSDRDGAKSPIFDLFPLVAPQP